LDAQKYFFVLSVDQVLMSVVISSKKLSEL